MKNAVVNDIIEEIKKNPDNWILSGGSICAYSLLNRSSHVLVDNLEYSLFSLCSIKIYNTDIPNISFFERIRLESAFRKWSASRSLLQYEQQVAK